MFRTMQGPVVEFNIQTDPEAAHVVFNSGVTLTMVPLEVRWLVCVCTCVCVCVCVCVPPANRKSKAKAEVCVHVNCPVYTDRHACVTRLQVTRTVPAVYLRVCVCVCVCVCTQVTHTVLVDRWVLRWVIHTDTPTHDTLRATDAFSRHATDTAAQSPFRQAIKHLMLFFKATYKEVCVCVYVCACWPFVLCHQQALQALTMLKLVGARVFVCLNVWAYVCTQVFGFEDPPLHDPVAVAAVIAPELFQVSTHTHTHTERERERERAEPQHVSIAEGWLTCVCVCVCVQFRELRVDIETNSVLSAGQTVCDIWRQSGKPPNCRVATAVDVDAFWVLMLRALACADRAAAAAAGNPGP